MRRPFLSTVTRYPPDGPQVSGEPVSEPAKGHSQRLTGTTLSSLPLYRRMGTLRESAQGCELMRPISPADYRRAFCEDARNLVMRCVLHACGNSCSKYTKGSKAPTCRHNFPHMVTFPEDGISVKRQGKVLRNCVCVVEETAAGMQGRIQSFQEHPFEGLTSYAGLVCMRSNMDLQDLRRVLVAYLPDVLPCLGDRPSWGWMNSGGATTDLPQATFPDEPTLRRLALLEQL